MYKYNCLYSISRNEKWCETSSQASQFWTIDFCVNVQTMNTAYKDIQSLYKQYHENVRLIYNSIVIKIGNLLTNNEIFDTLNASGTVSLLLFYVTRKEESIIHDSNGLFSTVNYSFHLRSHSHFKACSNTVPTVHTYFFHQYFLFIDLFLTNYNIIKENKKKKTTINWIRIGILRLRYQLIFLAFELKFLFTEPNGSAAAATIKRAICLFVCLFIFLLR